MLVLCIFSELRGPVSEKFFVRECDDFLLCFGALGPKHESQISLLWLPAIIFLRNGNKNLSFKSGKSINFCGDIYFDAEVNWKSKTRYRYFMT